MDSMRSLNRSLPSSSTASRPAPPEQLLQAFKQAALSVTNLYKSAATDHEAIRQAGYQDALDDLLKFLDRENLGLQDGEGWRVRQWATARYDGSAHTQNSESEDEQLDSDQRQRSASPEKASEEDDNVQQQPRGEHGPNPGPSAQPQASEQSAPRPIFQFSAGPDSIMSSDEPMPIPQPQPQPAADIRSTPVRVELVNKNKNAHKHNSRHNGRSIARTTSQAAGSKRKLPFPDISEIFNVGFDKKDGFDGGNGGGGGGSKRNRLV